MKKIITMLFILVLMCSSLASAGLFKDSFEFLTTGNLITGGVIAEDVNILEGEESVPAPEPAPAPEAAPAPEPIKETTPEPGPGAAYAPTDGQAPIVPGTENPPQDVQQPQQEMQQPVQQQPMEGCWKDGQEVPCEQVYKNQKQPEMCWKDGQEVPCEQVNNYQRQPYQQQGFQPKQDFKQTVCGDGICEGDEKYGCQDDCGWTKENPMKQFSNEYQKEQYGENWCANGQCCPDGICDEFEQKMGACFEDCNGYNGGQQNQKEWQNQPMNDYNNNNNGIGYGQYKEVKKEIDAVEALSIVLKLEEIKMKLGTDGALYNQIGNLYDYCESKGEDDCSKYQNALTMMVETSNAVEALLNDLRESIEAKGKLTQEDLMKLKSNIGNIVDKGMLKITYALIGVNIAVEDIVVEETYEEYQEPYNNEYAAICGNGLCEPDYGESYSECPADCMSETTEEVVEPIIIEPTEQIAEESTTETPTEEIIEEVIV